MKTIKNSQRLKIDKRTFFVPDKEQSKSYNKIKYELIKKYNLNTNSRDITIKSLISQLTQGDYLNFNIPNINLIVFRTDIKNFFPSVNKHKLYQKLNNSNILSSLTMTILKEAIFSKKVEGIPLGIQFSSHLSELYLEDFDSDIKKVFKPIAYFRYVDDIVIINYDFSRKKMDQLQSKEDITNQIDEIFSKYGLERNVKKTEFSYYNTTNLKSDLSFSYLGYSFKSTNSKLLISISRTKSEKIINKIKAYFYKFKTSTKSNEKFWTLYYNLKNTIYGIVSYDKKGKEFKFGLGYNYRFVNEDTSLNEIINIIKSLIYSCKLTSFKTATLLSVISYDSGRSIDILNKRFNYLKLTKSQKELIKKRLNKPSLPTGNTFAKRIFYSLYSK